MKEIFTRKLKAPQGFPSRPLIGEHRMEVYLTLAKQKRLRGFQTRQTYNLKAEFTNSK